MRPVFKFFLASGAAAFLIYLWLGGNAVAPPDGGTWRSSSSSEAATGGAKTWGNPVSLRDHFARHGADFDARDPQEYARMAAELLRRARMEGLPAKLDNNGVLRVFDPRSGAFGVYNRDGTTKTFFKPGDGSYFKRQPGRSINPQTWEWN